MLQKLLQHQGDQPPDVRQFRPELPEGVSRVLRRTLAKDPRHRYADPAELVDDLLVLAQEAGIQPWGLAGKDWIAPQPAGGRVCCGGTCLGGPAGGPAGDRAAAGLFRVAVPARSALPPPLGTGTGRPSRRAPPQGPRTRPGRRPTADCRPESRGPRAAGGETVAAGERIGDWPCRRRSRIAAAVSRRG